VPLRNCSLLRCPSRSRYHSVFHFWYSVESVLWQVVRRRCGRWRSDICWSWELRGNSIFNSRLSCGDASLPSDELRYIVPAGHNIISSHYVIVMNVFKEETSITLQELKAIEKMSFQSTCEYRYRCGRSDILRKLVPDRDGCDDEGAITNCRMSGSRNGKWRWCSWA